MLSTEKWEYSREEAKDLAQDYLDREETRANCIKYFISHFKISILSDNSQNMGVDNNVLHIYTI